jgi:uncharacterized protein
MTLQKTSDRIESIDVLRGFTLFGIALVHTVEQYYAGQPPQGVGIEGNMADGITQGLVGILISGKFFMIFSFLFGLSFFLQFSRSDEDSNFFLRFAWRLLILFAIGMIHHLHYRGDILGIYAMLGFTLLFLNRLPDKYLLILALLLVFNVPSIITRGVQLFFPPDNPFDQKQDELLAYYNTVKSGRYLDILRANLNSFAFKMQFQIFSGRIYITEGLFLLGVYAGRKRFFENVEQYLPFVKKWLRYSLFALLGAIVLGIAMAGIIFGLKLEVKQEILFLIGGPLADIANTALAAIYVGGILLLFQKEKWRKRLMVLYPVGRMGLTVYLLQTVFGTFIFFSYGLHLLFDIGAFYAFLIGFGFFILQIFFARWWFNHFAFGPVEWLWRTLTFFKVQKLTLAKMPVSTRD